MSLPAYIAPTDLLAGVATRGVFLKISEYFPTFCFVTNVTPLIVVLGPTPRRYDSFINDTPGSSFLPETSPMTLMQRVTEQSTAEDFG